MDGTGHPTAYLWQDIWQRDSWLEILGRYMIARRDKKKQISGIIFPRYHQLGATRKLRAQVKAEGAGGRFLIQHSAGSGKTNSIAWSAHFLADLHNDGHAKIFSSVIVVSDRNVIDAQLQEALFEFERTKGVVANRQAADERAEALRHIIMPMVDQGLSLSLIARRLNNMGVLSARGGRFFPEQVSLVVRRLQLK